MDERPTIVLGVDFSPSSERALATAIRMAKEWGAEVLLVHALKPLGSPGLDLSHPQYDPERNESADVTASDGGLADAWLHRVRQEVPAHLVSRPGRPVDVLIEEAQRVHARAIVVGSHGNTGLERTVLGSVAEGVLARSWLPVLVVPGRKVAPRPEVVEQAERPRWLD
ncbi:MAG TPA: universal stress protein [Candidatus Thermoplasmatota archaeon]|nr:universal stress protein [Candidatus Thermoplasmatota archaeon]